MLPKYKFPCTLQTIYVLRKPKRLVCNESLGIQIGKVHQRIRLGTGLLRNQVDGVVGEKADTETLPISSRK